MLVMHTVTKLVAFCSTMRLVEILPLWVIAGDGWLVDDSVRVSAGEVLESSHRLTTNSGVFSSNLNKMQVD